MWRLQRSKKKNARSYSRDYCLETYLKHVLVHSIFNFKASNVIIDCFRVSSDEKWISYFFGNLFTFLNFLKVVQRSKRCNLFCHKNLTILIFCINFQRGSSHWFTQRNFRQRAEGGKDWQRGRPGIHPTLPRRCPNRWTKRKMTSHKFVYFDPLSCTNILCTVSYLDCSPSLSDVIYVFPLQISDFETYFSNSSE